MNMNELPYIVYPFNESYQWTFTLSGTYVGVDPASIEVRVFDRSDDSTLVYWTALTNASITGGVWSGDITIEKQAVIFGFEARRSDTLLAASSVNDCMTAFIGGVCGQSNAAYFFLNGSGPNALTYMTTDGTTLDTLTGVGAIALANALNFAFQCPVVLVNRGVVGSSITTWISGGSNHSRIPGALSALSGGYCHALFWHQGETDGINDMATATYQGHEESVRGSYRSALTNPMAGDIPWFTAFLGRTTGNYPGYLNIIAAKINICDGDSGSYPIVCQDLTLNDTYHYTYDAAGYGSMGNRWAQAALNHFGKTAWHRGPGQVEWEILTDTTTRVRLALNSAASAVAPVSGIDSFQVNTGAWINATGAVDSYIGQYVDIILTHSSGTVTDVRCLWASYNTPIANIVRDNTTLTLPVEPSPSIIEYAPSTGGWLINDSSSGVAACDGTPNAYFQPSVGNVPTLSNSTTYRLYYEIINHVAGGLSLTGFCTETALNTSVGQHFVDVICSDNSQPIRIISDSSEGWEGTFDNLILIEKAT